MFATSFASGVAAGVGILFLLHTYYLRTNVTTYEAAYGGSSNPFRYEKAPVNYI